MDTRLLHAKTKPVYNHKTEFLIYLEIGSIALINLDWTHLITHEYHFTLKQKFDSIYSDLSQLHGT